MSVLGKESEDHHNKNREQICRHFNLLAITYRTEKSVYYTETHYTGRRKRDNDKLEVVSRLQQQKEGQ